MNWPSAVDIGVFSTGVFLGGGTSAALVQALFHRPKEKALTEAVKTETNIEVLKLWMNGIIVSNEKLVETNARLERDKKRLESKSDWQRRELNAHRSLALIIEWLIPKFQVVLDVGEITKLNDSMERVKHFSNHHDE
jgi:hypothetical protein